MSADRWLSARIRSMLTVAMLASDALHFYEELDRDRPFTILYDLQ
ncbi:MAG: hypothetical protein ACYCU0_00340 [Solirubrobacteraceae bacterium]